MLEDQPEPYTCPTGDPHIGWLLVTGEARSPPPGSIVPGSLMIREADPPTRTIPRFPTKTTPWTHQAILPGTGHPGYQPTNPAVETKRKCTPGSICSPHVPDGHMKTHHHRLTDSVPASPHPVRLMAAVLQRPEAPSPPPDCLPGRPVIAVQSGKVLSPEEHLGCTHSPPPGAHNVTLDYTSHGYRHA